MTTLSVLECVELLAVAFAPLLIVVLSEGLNVIDPGRLQRLDG